MPTLQRVNARSGLRLRGTPNSTNESNVIKTLPFGALVHSLNASDGWTLVDLEGDGAADGFVSTAYLQDATGGADSDHIARLIALGSSAEGLAQARKTAAGWLGDYPHNGCAAHLSALLQAAGIGVPKTLGAGDLAHTLQARGWRRIPRGGQQAGDVGVTYDLDPSRPGADHIYLVVEALGEDRMMIADNQRTEDRPHERYASGAGGKTPTEYFLRA